ncbi:MAG TPA: baseplate J/gp47 family protein [Acetobacteraceae bacterium]|nr:baseplate J/gp47 family protein [Acetobacteraceae bacterium]
MQLSLRTFSTLVQSMAAAVEASATQLLDLTVGSTLRAVLEANASIGLWMQWLILQVLRTTRAATSNGADLDSWMADLTLTRLPAVAATGTVTFSRFTPGMTALIPAGALIRTADGTQTFAVGADTTQPSWSAASNGYVMAGGIASINVPVIAQTPGSAGNVQAGTVSLLASALPGIESVSNGSAFQNGLDAESDDAFRSRFRNFIASRSRATPVAVGYAISSIQQGLNYTIQENIDPSGQPHMGSFVVTVDDGSGSPSTALLSAVQTAIDAMRPVGSIFSVQSPTVLTANVSLTITVPAGTTKAPVQALVGNAIGSYINSLTVGAGLPLTKLAQIAYSASPTVVNVGALLANGSAGDITVAVNGVVKAGVIAVN